MINEEKIRIMTKLAIYDKHYEETDRKANEFFLSDYIYRKNFWTRLFALFGCFIVILFNIIEKVVVEGVDPFFLDYKQEGIHIATFIAVVLAFYTLVSTILATKQYNISMKRIKKQLGLMKQLEKVAAQAEEPAEDDYNPYYDDYNKYNDGYYGRFKEDSSLYYGTDIRDKRDPD